MLKISCLKDMDGVYPFNISGVYGGKECEQEKVGVDVIAVTTHKTPFVVN